MDARASVQSFPCNLHHICISPRDRSLLLHFVRKSPMGFHRAVRWVEEAFHTDRFAPLEHRMFLATFWQTLVRSPSNKDKESSCLTALGQAFQATLVPHIPLICLLNGWWKARNFSPDQAWVRCHQPQVHLCNIHAEQDLAVSSAV